jgi:hypothetical protein
MEATVKRAIDVNKAFAVEEPTRPSIATQAGDATPEYEVDISDL